MCTANSIKHRQPVCAQRTVLDTDCQYIYNAQYWIQRRYMYRDQYWTQTACKWTEFNIGQTDSICTEISIEHRQSVYVQR